MAEQTVYGIRIGYTENGRGAPVLCLHSWCADRGQFDALSKAVPGKKFVMPDLPGHGKSAKPFVEHSIVFMAEVMVGFVEKTFKAKPIIVSQGMGVAVALEMAHQNQNGLAGLFCLNPPSQIIPRTFDRARQKDIAALEEHGFRTWFKDRGETVLFEDDEPDHIRQRIMDQVANTEAHVCTSTLKSLIGWQGKQQLKSAATLPMACLVTRQSPELAAILDRYAPTAGFAQILFGNRDLANDSTDQVSAVFKSFCAHHAL